MWTGDKHSYETKNLKPFLIRKNYFSLPKPLGNVFIPKETHEQTREREREREREKRGEEKKR